MLSPYYVQLHFIIIIKLFKQYDFCSYNFCMYEKTKSKGILNFIWRKINLLGNYFKKI